MPYDGQSQCLLPRKSQEKEQRTLNPYDTTVDLPLTFFKIYGKIMPSSSSLTCGISYGVGTVSVLRLRVTRETVWPS